MHSLREAFVAIINSASAEYRQRNAVTLSALDRRRRAFGRMRGR